MRPQATKKAKLRVDRALTQRKIGMEQMCRISKNASLERFRITQIQSKILKPHSFETRVFRFDKEQKNGA